MYYMKQENELCHKCRVMFPKDETLDCSVCELSTRCFDCIPNYKKVFNEDGSFKYVCLQCIRKKRAPTSLYEMLNMNTIVK